MVGILVTEEAGTQLYLCVRLHIVGCACLLNVEEVTGDLVPVVQVA